MSATRASPSSSIEGGSEDGEEDGHLPGSEQAHKGGLSRWLQQDAQEKEEQQEEGSLGSGGDGAAAAARFDTSPGGGGGSDSETAQLEPAPAALRPMYDMRQECRNVDVHFQKIAKISEGTFGVVYKAKEKATGRVVALKKYKLWEMDCSRDGFPKTSLREINILLNFHHPNIVNVEEVVVSPQDPDGIFLVMEHMDHDLKSLLKSTARLSTGQAKCLLQQLLAGVAFLHHHWVLHRDLKTSNILYNGHGDLKLCDFGMARQYGEPLGNYTTLVVTLWYRAPELLFGAKKYSTAVDMWSVGCIMGEILTGKPLLPGQGEFDQIDKMVQLLGNPTTEEWPGLEQLPEFKKISLKKVPSQLRQRFTASTGFVGGGTSLTESGLDLLARLLQWNPDKRISAADALNHPWFSEAPKPVARVLMPTFAPRKAS